MTKSPEIRLSEGDQMIRIIAMQNVAFLLYGAVVVGLFVYAGSYL